MTLSKNGFTKNDTFRKKPPDPSLTRREPSAGGNTLRRRLGTVADGKAPRHIGSRVRSIRPAVKKCDKGDGIADSDAVARENIRQTVKKICAPRPILSKLAKEVNRGMRMNFTAWNPGKLNYYN